MSDTFDHSAASVSIKLIAGVIRRHVKAAGHEHDWKEKIEELTCVAMDLANMLLAAAFDRSAFVEACTSKCDICQGKGYYISPSPIDNYGEVDCPNGCED